MKTEIETIIDSIESIGFKSETGTKPAGYDNGTQVFFFVKEESLIRIEYEQDAEDSIAEMRGED